MLTIVAGFAAGYVIAFTAECIVLHRYFRRDREQNP